MKKNITINLFGQLYNIDEDAYELLAKYQQSMCQYFSDQEGGDEIADDVERRVAELLGELKAGGRVAITIEDVTEIIHRIGDPRQMDGADSCSQPAEEAALAEAPGKRVRSLYRDPDGRFPGGSGICSGLCYYFGWKEPVFLRLAFVVLALAPYHLGIFLYILLLFIIPEARTPEEKLRMRGEPVTPDNISAQLMSDLKMQKKKKNAVHRVPRGRLEKTVASVAEAVIFAGKWLAYGALMLASMGIIVVLAIYSIALIHGRGFLLLEQLPHRLVQPFFESVTLTVLVGIFLVALLVVVMWPWCYMTKRALLNFHYGEVPSPSHRLRSVVIWLAVAVIVAVSGIMSAVMLGNQAQLVERRENTRNGIFLSEGSWNFLREQGWTLERLKNACEYIDGRTKDPRFAEDNLRGHVSIGRDGNQHENLVFSLSRKETVTAGRYRFSVLYSVPRDKKFAYRLTLPRSTRELQGVLGDNTPGTRFSDWPWEKAREDLALVGDNTAETWPKVQKRAGKKRWHYFSVPVDVDSAGVLKYTFYQDEPLASSGMGVDNLHLYGAWLTRLGDLPQASLLSNGRK